MAQNDAYGYGRPSAFSDSQPQTENTVFSPRLVESMNSIPRVRSADCILTEKNLHISGPGWFKSMLFKSQLNVVVLKVLNPMHFSRDSKIECPILHRP